MLSVAMLVLSQPAVGAAQQVPDRGFDPPIGVATFAQGAGPVVGIDAALKSSPRKPLHLFSEFVQAACATRR